MPISSQLQIISMQTIQHYAPDSSGVYALYDRQGRVIYYGMSTNSIRGRLMDHFNGKEGKCTQSAYYFNYEGVVNAPERERELLKSHVNTFKSLPHCNEKIG